jgi:hypothetical protein
MSSSTFDFRYTKSAEMDSRSNEHLVEFYKADELSLVRNVTAYLRDGLRRGEGVLVIATREHRDAFAAELTSDLAAAAIREGRLAYLDGEQTLSWFLSDGHVDPKRFERTVGGAVRSIRAKSQNAGARAYGEMVGLLWDRGQVAQAVELERLWNKLIEAAGFKLYCGYGIDIFGPEFSSANVDAVMCAHSKVVPSRGASDVQRAVELAMEDILGDRIDSIRPLMQPNHRPSWAAMPRGESMILWIRNNLQPEADAIIRRARLYFDAGLA